MSEVKAHIDIDAPIETVWETIMDPQRLGDWVTIHKSVKNASSPPLKAGATMEQSMSVRGVTFKVHWNLASAERAASRRLAGHRAGPLRGSDPLRTGGNRYRDALHLHNEFHPPGGKLGMVASRFIVGATSEREAENSLKKLKRLLESNAEYEFPLSSSFRVYSLTCEGRQTHSAGGTHDGICRRDRS